MTREPGREDDPRSAGPEAAAWLARLRSELRTPADERGFQHWLAEDPRHGDAFDDVTAAFEAAGALAGHRWDAPDAGPRRRNRRQLLIGGAVSAAAVAGVVAWRAAEASILRTRIGEQRWVTLEDSTRLLLDTNSAARLDFSRVRRRVELLSGRAYFDVAKDPTRPFIVQAGDREVIAIGTAFSVERGREDTSVVLEEGQVVVRGPDQARGGRAPLQPMAPGDRLVFALSATSRQDRPDLAQATAWQQGRAIFEDQSLQAAADELNRYNRRVIEIADPDAAALRVSGVFRTADPEAFARSVALLLPLDVEAREDRIILRSRPA